jgi:arylformamidase
MIKYIDISLPVTSELPGWPGSQKFTVSKSHDIKNGDEETNSTISMNLHTGTHIDAPSHFIRDGKTVEQIPLEFMIGSAVVVRVPEEIKEITADILSMINIPSGTKRLLLHTANSSLWDKYKNHFYKDFTALSSDGAEWLVAAGIKLVGIDYLSIQRFSDGPQVHQILLSAEVIIIEGLNLSDVEAGMYQLYCLPLRLQHLEAAPARVLLGYDESKDIEDNA